MLLPVPLECMDMNIAQKWKPRRKIMSTWKYEFGDKLKLHLEDKSIASYEGKALSGDCLTGDAVLEGDFLLQEIDAEVHRLTALIKESEYTIYKLRKWQKVMKKNET
jgi:hypothetical protein